MKNAWKFVGVAIAAFVSLPAAAQAQDMDGSASYAGPRIEARYSYEFVSSGLRNISNAQNRGQFGDDSIDESGNPGAEIGFDGRFGGVVAGVYGGVDFSDSAITQAGRPYLYDTGRNLYAGGRVGIVSRGVLVYAKGGYSNGRVTPKVLAGGNAAFFNGFKRNRDGFHVGLGAEFKLAGNFYGKPEYVYSRYDRQKIGAVDEFQFNRHQLVAAVGVRF